MKYTVKLCPRTCIMESTYKGLKSVSLEQLIHFLFVITIYVLNKFSSIKKFTLSKAKKFRLHCLLLPKAEQGLCETWLCR